MNRKPKGAKLALPKKTYSHPLYEKADQVKTKEDLDRFLTEAMAKKDVGYGEIVIIMSACMLAVSKYVDRSPIGGITGFQASFVGWEMVKEFIERSKVGMSLLNYEKMLYPQYRDMFSKKIDKDVWKELQKLAKKRLRENPDAHPAVIRHWKKIVDGKIPFGYKIKEESANG